MAVDEIDIPEDSVMESIRLKQLRLLTIHETLGHLNFSILKLMSKGGLIPADLANVESPQCPGCAYGKACWKQWRHKGIHNHKPILSASTPVSVVSIDQLISPTPGFVPIHR